MKTLPQLEKEVKELQKRNARVDTNKAWETSLTRKLVLSALIYLLALGLFASEYDPHIYTDALLPAVAFLISTLTIQAVKNWWVKRVYKF